MKKTISPFRSSRVMAVTTTLWLFTTTLLTLPLNVSAGQFRQLQWQPTLWENQNAKFGVRFTASSPDDAFEKNGNSLFYDIYYGIFYEKGIQISLTGQPGQKLLTCGDIKQHSCLSLLATTDKEQLYQLNCPEAYFEFRPVRACLPETLAAFPLSFPLQPLFG